MFWHLLFAHLVADYPLQPDWMVTKKANPAILALHVGVHFGLMLAVVGAMRSFIWPYLLALAGIHYTIDLVKNWLNAYRPRWVIVPYIIDQLLHFSSIWLVASWIDARFLNLALPLSREAFIYLNAFLLVTYVWYISERIFAYQDTIYRKEVIEQVWTRMIARGAFLAGLLAFLGWFTSPSLWSTVAFPFPYISGKYRTRALLTDVGISIAGVIFILSAV